MKPGYYLCSDRCFYLTGTKKGNRWIYLDIPYPEWCSLNWMCLPKNYDLTDSKYSKTNPTKFL